MNSQNFHTIDQAQSLLKKEFQKRYGNCRNKSQSSVRDSQKSHYRKLSTTLKKNSKFTKQQQRLSNSVEIEHSSKLSQTLQHINFNHHQKDSCLCENCTCGRHLCKLEVIKPELSKQTHYQKIFVKKHSSQQTPILVPQETNPLKANNLDMETLYFKEFKQRIMDKLQRPKLSDHLSLFNGPAQTITTYGSLYPGHRGDNQYVKPTNKCKMGNFPLFGKTSYNAQFVNKKPTQSWLDRVPDHLKEGTTWMGSTTYGNNFKNPNPEDYAARTSMKIQKYQKQPDNANKFKTHYMKEFVGKQSTICPSKIELRIKSRNMSTAEKSLYRQNSDFRALSPDFHPLSNSTITYN